MMTTNTITIDPRLPANRAGSAGHRVDQLERRIGAARMNASLESDWDQLHIRSRTLSARITDQIDPQQQIAIVRDIRAHLRRTDDTFGLRALRLAAATPMAGWLSHPETRAAARNVARMFEIDQRLGIPGMADLETQLERAITADASSVS